MLHGFEDAVAVEALAKYWPAGNLRGTREFATEGRQALAFTLPAGRSCGVRLLSKPLRLSGYAEIAFDLTQRNGPPISLYLHLHDTSGGRASRRFSMPAERNSTQHVRLRLDEFRGVERLDLDDVNVLVFYAGSVPSPIEYVLDHVRVEKRAAGSAQPLSAIPIPIPVYAVPERTAASVTVGADEATSGAIALRIGKARPFVGYLPADIRDLAANRPQRDQTVRAADKALRLPLLCQRTKRDDGSYVLGDTRSLGLAWQVTQDARYAWRSRQILLAAARVYRAMADTTHPYVWGNQPDRQQPDYFVGNGSPGMSEAGLLADLAIDYDLVADSGVFSPADRERVETDLLRLGVDKLYRDPAFKARSNQGVCQQGPAGVVGLALEDPVIVRRALADFQDAVGYGVLEGGYWWEGHAYGGMSLSALEHFARVANRSGMALFDLPCRPRREGPPPASWPTLVSALEHPLHIAAPNMAIPNINDNGGSIPVTLATVAHVYGIAPTPFCARYAKYMLTERMPNAVSPLRGDPRVMSAAPLQLDSVNWPGSGLGILRSGRGVDPDDTYVLVDYGPCGAHGHLDLLQVVIYGQGAYLAPDLGSSATSSGYAELNRSYCAQAFTHNTVVVNELTQAPVRGECEFFAVAPGFQAIEVSSDQVYPGARLHRTVCLVDTFVVILDRCETIDGAPATWDWCFHGEGEWVSEETGHGEIGDAPSYDHIQWRSVLDAGGGVRGRWQGEEQGLSLHVLPASRGGQAFLGNGPYPLHGDPGIHPDRRVHFLVVRRRGEHAGFAAVAEPCREQPWITAVSREGDGRLRIALRGGSAWTMHLAPPGTPVAAGVRHRAELTQDGHVVRRATLAAPHRQVSPATNGDER